MNSLLEDTLIFLTLDLAAHKKLNPVYIYISRLCVFAHQAAAAAVVMAVLVVVVSSSNKSNSIIKYYYYNSLSQVHVRSGLLLTDT
jgi:hypothetical protein